MEVDQQSSTTDGDTTKNVLALLFTISPLYFLSQTRSRFGLQSFHLGLLQVLLLLLFRNFLNWRKLDFLFAGRTNAKVRVSRRREQVLKEEDQEKEEVDSGYGGEGDEFSLFRRGRTGRKKKPPTLYPPALLNRTLYDFLTLTLPSYADFLPTPSPPSPSTFSPTPLEDWTTLYTTPTLTVLQNPNKKVLYAIRATFPDVSVRKLYESVIDLKRRTEWDMMAVGCEKVEGFEVGKGNRWQGEAVWIGMKGLMVVRPKDLCLLSIVARLPPTPEELLASSTPKIICSTTSFAHPLCPPRKGFNRMEVAVSGFIIEEDKPGGQGSIFTQVTDLTELGTWIPTAIINTVTQTILPKSIYKLGKFAERFDIENDSRFPPEGDGWFPPLLSKRSLEEEEESEDEKEEILEEKEMSRKERERGRAVIAAAVEEADKEREEMEDEQKYLVRKIIRNVAVAAVAAGVVYRTVWNKRRK